MLHVNQIDLIGRHFNGYDLIDELRPLGVDCQQAVLTKQSENPNVFSLWSGRVDEDIHSALTRIEERRSMDNLLFPWGRRLASSSAFAGADVVHYHLIHGGTISLLDMPHLTTLKPSVWTFHDPWPLTGHCVHPVECEGWLRGCVGCNSLDSLFALREDNSNRMWKVKRDSLAAMNVDIVVASEFMLDMVQRSPITSRQVLEDRVHLVPFGINTDSFLPTTEKSASRRRLGIPEEDFTILFRSTQSGLKGQEYILEALGAHPPSRPTTLLTVDTAGLVDSLSSDYRVSERGWISDEDEYRRVLSACDVLLMPSPAESFGLMALEAMAAGRPVICFEGTALAALTKAPECGIAVPFADSMALRAAIDRLSESSEEVDGRGAVGRSIAARNHRPVRYLQSLANIYGTVLQSHAGAMPAK